MKKEDKKLCNFWLPNDIYEYLKLKSKSEYMSMTDYVIQFILKDMKNYKIENGIK